MRIKLAVVLSLSVLLFTAAVSFAEENKKNAPEPSAPVCLLPNASMQNSQPECLIKEDPLAPKPLLYSVSSEDFDSDESLNRVAGNYDTGLVAKEDTYKSKKNERVNPLRERSYDEVSH